METINLYTAIAQMRKLTKEGKTFAFTFMSYDRTKQKPASHPVEVTKAKFRKAAKEENLIDADNKLFFLDVETNEPKVCHQAALMFFEGKKIVLS